MTPNPTFLIASALSCMLSSASICLAAGTAPVMEQISDRPMTVPENGPQFSKSSSAFRHAKPKRDTQNTAFRSMGTCSDFVYTQSTDPTSVEADNSVLCSTGLGHYQHWFGRHHDLSVGPAAGQPTLLDCVTLGAQSNNQDITLTINAYLDDDGIERPNTDSMTLLGSTDLTFLEADGFPKISTATFNPPVSLPPDTRLFIEIIVPEQRSPEFPVPGFFLIGSNSAGESDNSWVRTEATQCGLTDWATTSEIGFSSMHLVESVGISINDDFDPCDLTVAEECGADTSGDGQPGEPDGIVNLSDFSLLLVEFGTAGDGTFRPLSDFAPLPNGDCQVDLQDFSAMLVQWGQVCEPEVTGACCYVAIGDTENSCDVMTEAQCGSLIGSYLGDDVTCDGDPCIEPVEQAWLNELHYDNAGGDTGEFLEIYISDGLNPADVEVYLYNGSGGTTYQGPWTLSSDFIAGDNVGGGRLYHRNQAGIQNGSPDGIAILIDGVVSQFLSYEGQFTATDGPADGQNSIAIPIAESGSSGLGSSIGLTGSGSAYEDFTWTTFTASTPGSLNDGQTSP
ncbi:MAG: hypothetical protein P8J86_09720 [Phycisphaerales bacterium]|nr:hypothetical protein [Phycisphaerales bacterium]